MLRYLIVLLLGAILGVVIYWYAFEGRRDPRVRQAEQDMARSVSKMGEAIRDTVAEISVEDIKAELARSGRVVRQTAKSAAGVFAGDEADARITSTIKEWYASDPLLKVQTIEVKTKGGKVTLSGTVGRAEDIARAMQLAMQAPGVIEVDSGLQVRRVL
jgi:osmotically-inducible protein OsmY